MDSKTIATDPSLNKATTSTTENLDTNLHWGMVFESGQDGQSTNPITSLNKNWLEEEPRSSSGLNVIEMTDEVIMECEKLCLSSLPTSVDYDEKKRISNGSKLNENTIAGLPDDLVSLKSKLKSSPASAIPDQQIEGNPVGTLQELCSVRKWIPPEYETIKEEGLPHQRQFTVCCEIGELAEIGIGKSKKIAKRLAAYNMIRKVISIQSEEDNDLRIAEVEDEDEVEELAPNGKNVKGPAFPAGRKLDSCFSALRGLEGEKLNELRKQPLETFYENCVTFLEELSNELKFSVTYIPFDELSMKGLHQCVVQFTLLPSAVCHGTGNTADIAKKEAAYGALDFIKVVTRVI